MSRGHKVWIFGPLERETNHLKLFPVDIRSADDLLSLIQGHVSPGSTIYSDGWSAYNGLSALGYKHFEVEHKYSFKQVCKDVATGKSVTVHTNTI